MIKKIRGAYRAVLNYRQFLYPISAVRFVAAPRITGQRPVKLKTHRLVPETCYLRPRTTDRYTAREILIDEEYSSAVEGLPVNATVVDIGANIGLATRYFATRLPESRVYAVEAMPNTYEITRLNLSVPGLADRCQVVNAAAWSEDTTISIQVPYEGAFSRASVSSEASGIQVRAKTIGALMDEFGIERADLLKMDIEGAEVQAFATADDWLPRVDCVAIEFHDDSREKCGFDALMHKHGFTITRHSDHTVVAVRGT